MSSDHLQAKDKENGGRPPVFRTWPVFYAVVIGWLALLIVFFYLFTQYFS